MKRMTLTALTIISNMKNRNRIFLWIFSVLPLLITLTSCDSNMVFEEYRPLEANTWNTSNLMKYNVNITDVNTPYDFYINVRVGSNYKYANLYLFLKTLYPKGKVSIDTVECYFADMDGRWLGERSGSSIDNRILLRKGIKFSEAGLYSFEFEQAMRDTALQNIEDFGIRIEKAEQ